MNELVFLRHGHALNAGEAGVSCDAERPLSARGISEARQAAARLKAEEFRPELIISSPLRRAEMTAEIAADFFPRARRLSAAALCEGNPADVVKMLSAAALPEGAGLLVVGHQPLLGSLAGFFLAREDFTLFPAGFVRIKTAGAGFTAGPANVLTEHYTPGGNTF